jgi:hypothetical protein
VNLSVTWWPNTFNHECFTIRPIQRCALHGIGTNSTPWLIFHTSLAIVSPSPLGCPFLEFYQKLFYTVFNKDIEMS